jgi:hypothetical protein
MSVAFGSEELPVRGRHEFNESLRHFSIACCGENVSPPEASRQPQAVDPQPSISGRRWRLDFRQQLALFISGFDMSLAKKPRINGPCSGPNRCHRSVECRQNGGDPWVTASLILQVAAYSALLQNLVDQYLRRYHEAEARGHRIESPPQSN